VTLFEDEFTKLAKRVLNDRDNIVVELDWDFEELDRSFRLSGMDWDKES